MVLRNGLLVLILLMPAGLWAADTSKGPVITNFGPVYAVPGEAWNLEPGHAYKVSMDVSEAADFTGDLNRQPAF